MRGRFNLKSTRIVSSFSNNKAHSFPFPFVIDRIFAFYYANKIIYRGLILKRGGISRYMVK